MSVIERAQQEANAEWRGTIPREAYVSGASFAATITAEQVEAAARAIYTSRGSDMWEREQEAVRQRYRTEARAAFVAAGFEVPPMLAPRPRADADRQSVNFRPDGGMA
jgi:hypothetical protein